MQAQDISVSGKVTSATDKQGIPGVNVVLKGTLKGTATDVYGFYKLEVPPDGILVFSFTGMQKQEVPVNALKVIDVELVEEKVDLGEVVVVGYSTSSKKLINGSVGIVGEEEIKNLPVRTIDGVLQGRAAGLSITPNSGTPGADNPPSN
jgi:hypothetical protein